jgi:glycerophosphoryl diester phosphodiesterase
LLYAALASAAESGRNGTLWTFDDAANRLAAAQGPGTLGYFDPDGTGWGPASTTFGSASHFGLPPMPGGDAQVMRFPAPTARQGYLLRHGGPPNGPFGKTHGVLSNYTLIADLLYTTESDGRWRPLIQTSAENAGDAEFAVEDAVSGGIGTIGLYQGTVRPNTWHRIAIVVQAAPEEGKAQQFIDGRFVGGIGTTDAALGIRWTLDPALLLFADGAGRTAPGYVSSLYFVDRALPMSEIQALGGPHAGGILTPGAPAPALQRRLPPAVSALGHRGGFFCCAPDNTMAAVRQALARRIPVIEIDTRLSADGVPVLVHDAVVDRTTNGTGAVASMTVAQLKQLDAGSWFAPEFTGERIATVAEVMTEAKGKVVLYFDLKVKGQGDAIARALKDTGFDPAGCWFWVYGDTDEAAAIRSRIPGARIIWSTPPEDWATLPGFFDSMRMLGVYGFDLGTTYVETHQSFVRAARAAGFVVAVHTVMDPESMLRFAHLGADYIETDFPHVVQELAAEPSRVH